MKKIEIDCSENLLCPFCSKVLVDVEEIEYKICEHTIFVASDHGFDFVREDIKNKIDENLASGSSYDSYTGNLSIEGVRIAQYATAPSFFGAYWGF